MDLIAFPTEGLKTVVTSDFIAFVTCCSEFIWTLPTAVHPGPETAYLQTISGSCLPVVDGHFPKQLGIRRSLFGVDVQRTGHQVALLVISPKSFPAFVVEREELIHRLVEKEVVTFLI